MSEKRHASWVAVCLPAPSGIFGLVVFMVLAATQGARILADGDTYTHIASGAWMLANDAVLRTDIYSHTVSGQAWIAHEWGAQVLMAGLHQAGGLPAVGIAFSAIAALSMTILYRTLERQGVNPWGALALMTVTLTMTFPHLFARPHLFTWLAGAICFDLLQREGRWRWLIPPLLAVWCNLHGGFILGLALQMVFLTGRTLDHLPVAGWPLALRERQQDLLILLVSLLACLCNPFGGDALLFYATVSSIEVTRFNPEWMAPDLQSFWPFRVYLVILLLFLFCRQRRPGWTNLLLLAGLIDAALAHRRHISLAVMFLMPLWVELLSLKTDTSSAKSSRDLSLSGWSGPLTLTIVSGILLLGGILLPQSFHDQFSRLFPVSARFPHQAWAWITEHKPQGRVLNEYSWGAMLIYRSAGEIPVFIDGFADKYGEQVYGDYYRIARLETETDELLDKYRVDWVLFPTDAPLVRYLTATGRWELGYRDSQASVLTRKAPESE